MLPLQSGIMGGEQGDEVAQYSRHSIICGFPGVTQDATEAFKWFSKAADQEIKRHNMLLLRPIMKAGA